MLDSAQKFLSTATRLSGSFPFLSVSKLGSFEKKSNLYVNYGRSTRFPGGDLAVFSYAASTSSSG